MEWTHAAAAAVFAATFLLLALGRIGRLPIPRGASALLGGAATWLLLAPAGDMPLAAWAAVDWQVMALLAGLMALAGLAELAGLFAGVRRRLVRMRPGWALWLATLLVAATSAAILNDAAVVVLVPFLLPALTALGLPAVASVVLLAVAANVGSLLTPFGNPQNAVLAATAGLGVVEFVRAQGLLVAAGVALLAASSAWFARGARPEPSAAPAPTVPHGRAWVAACIAGFLALAALAPQAVGLGGAAALAALAAWGGLRPRLGPMADRAALRSIDLNVMALFAGLYLLTAGLAAWFPTERLSVSHLDHVAEATAATTLLSNAVGNVPAVLTFAALDESWTRLHAAFLVSVSTLGGAILLTGSAASLLAADQARKLGVEVGFAAFLRVAAPVALPLLVLGAWLNWPATGAP